MSISGAWRGAQAGEDEFQGELVALGACDLSRWERVPSCVKHCNQYIPPCQ